MIPIISLFSLLAHQEPKAEAVVLLTGIELSDTVVANCLRAETLTQAKEALGVIPGRFEIKDGMLTYLIGDPGGAERSKAVADLYEKVANTTKGPGQAFTLKELGLDSRDQMMRVNGFVPPHFAAYSNWGSLKSTAVPSLSVNLEIDGKLLNISFGSEGGMGDPAQRVNARPTAAEQPRDKGQSKEYVTIRNGLLIRYSVRGHRSEKLSRASQLLRTIGEEVSREHERFIMAHDRLSQILGAGKLEKGQSFTSLSLAAQKELKAKVRANPDYRNLKEHELDAMMLRLTIGEVRPRLTLGFDFDWSAEGGGSGVRSVIGP